MKIGPPQGKSLRKAAAFIFVLTLACAALAQTIGWVGARRAPAGKDLNAVYFVDAKHGWIAGDDGFVSYTDDGGRTWSQQTTSTQDGINDIYFRNKEEGYLLAGNSIFKTTDGGAEWREMSRFLPDIFGGAMPELYSLRFVGKKKGWVVGSVSRRDRVVDSLVIYTDDGGVSWQQKRVPTKNELIHLDFVDDERGWIVGAAGTILHTENGGETWRPQSSGSSVTLYHVEFRNKTTGWAVGERATILRTTDGGQTWRPVTVPVRGTLLSVKFVDEEEGWIVGRGGLILRSEDGGLSWLQQESKTRQNLYALFINKKMGWAVGGDGMVLQYER